MSKPRLQLVHSSNGSQPRAAYRQRDRSFRPSVIKGGRASSVLAMSSWDAGLDLINLGLLASCLNYLAFVQASMDVLEASRGSN